MSYGFRIARPDWLDTPLLSQLFTFMDSIDGMKFRVLLPEKVLLAAENLT